MGTDFAARIRRTLQEASVSIVWRTWFNLPTCRSLGRHSALVTALLLTLTHHAPGRAETLPNDRAAARVTDRIKATSLSVEPFEADTLSAWRTTLQRPAWVIFTATWCAVCPSVVDDLRRTARQHPAKPSVWVVVTDVAPGDDDARLLGTPHLRAADRLLAFEGQPPAIRYAVDPSWRGAVPYVVLMDKGGSVRKFTGRPSNRELQRPSDGR